MKLYSANASPFARKVRMALIETDLASQVEIVLVSGTPTDTGTMPLAQNPLGKLPALERKEGPALYDSNVICQYLDDLGNGSLYPDGPRRWETLTLEATADGIMEAAVLMVYEGRVRPEELQYEDWVEAQWCKVTRALDAVESRWMSHLAGPFDASHIAMATALGYLDFRHGPRDWRSGRPALAKWLENLESRPSYAETLPSA